MYSSSTSKQSSVSSSSIIDGDTLELSSVNLQKVFSHPFLPYDEINNEQYKTLLCHKLNKQKYHSKSKVFALYTHSLIQAPEQIPCSFLSKKFKAISCQKQCIGKLCLYSNVKPIQYIFPLYKDKDIGFNDTYKVLLTSLDYDNDYETDEEELELGQNKCLEKFTEDFKQFNPKQISRKLKYKKTRKCKDNP